MTNFYIRSTRNSPLMIDETSDDLVEPVPPITYRNRQFTPNQLAQIQDILILDLASSIENGYAFQEAGVNLSDIFFESVCSKLDQPSKVSPGLSYPSHVVLDDHKRRGNTVRVTQKELGGDRDKVEEEQQTQVEEQQEESKQVSGAIPQQGQHAVPARCGQV